MSVFVVLAAAALPLYSNIRLSGQINNASNQIVEVIRTAREQSAARVNNARHGVYFNVNAGGDDTYTLYQGNTYATRNSTYDIIFSLESNLSITTTFTGDDINFSRGAAVPSTTGAVTLVNTTGATRIITVNGLGLVEEQ